MNRFPRTLAVSSAAIALSLALSHSPVQAKGIQKRAVVTQYVGAGVVATKVVGQIGGPDLLTDGTGLSLFGGIRFGRVAEIELGWTAVVHRGTEPTLISNGFTADVKLYVSQMRRKPAKRRLRPFVQAGGGVYLVDSVFLGAHSSGGGFQLGGGFTFEVTDQVDLGARALYRGVSMGPQGATYRDTFVSSVGLEGNVSFHF